MNMTTTTERLIARYLNGSFSEEDETTLFSWIKQSPENEKKFIEIKDSWDASLQFQNREAEQLLLFYKKRASTKKHRLSLWLSGAAAILLVGLFLGSVLQQTFSTNFAQTESYYVPTGSHSELTLADGTRVKLNADSRLEICAGFSLKKRQVKLTGEGFFEVKSDKNHPFTVQTPKFDVRVTGTKFNVSSYTDDKKVSATLSEGSIELTTKDDQVIHLNPGEKVSLDQASMKVALEKADLKTELAWVNGEFIFKEIPFPDLVKRLERWYDVKLTYHSTELNSMTYSGSFKNQETIWQVLDALKLTSPINYQKNNFREFELSYQPMN